MSPSPPRIPAPNHATAAQLLAGLARAAVSSGPDCPNTLRRTVRPNPPPGRLFHNLSDPFKTKPAGPSDPLLSPGWSYFAQFKG